MAGAVRKRARPPGRLPSSRYAALASAGGGKRESVND